MCTCTHDGLVTSGVEKKINLHPCVPQSSNAQLMPSPAGGKTAWAAGGATRSLTRIIAVVCFL